MKVKVLEIRLNGKPVFVGKVEEVPVMDFLTRRKEAERNLQNLRDEDTRLRREIKENHEAIKELRKEIAELRGESA